MASRYRAEKGDRGSGEEEEERETPNPNSFLFSFSFQTRNLGFSLRNPSWSVTFTDLIHFFKVLYWNLRFGWLVCVFPFWIWGFLIVKILINWRFEFFSFCVESFGEIFRSVVIKSQFCLFDGVLVVLFGWLVVWGEWWSEFGFFSLFVLVLWQHKLGRGHRDKLQQFMAITGSRCVYLARICCLFYWLHLDFLRPVFPLHE